MSEKSKPILFHEGIPKYPHPENGATFFDADLVEEFNAFDPLHGRTLKNVNNTSKAVYGGAAVGFVGVAQSVKRWNWAKSVVRKKTGLFPEVLISCLLMSPLYGGTIGAILANKVAESRYPIPGDAVLEAEAKFNEWLEKRG